MNPQYMNQQPPGGMNPGYRMPPASQGSQGYGGPPPGPHNPYGGPAPNMSSPSQNMGGSNVGGPPPNSMGGPMSNHMGGPPPNSMAGPPNMLNGPSQRAPGPPGTFGKAQGPGPIGGPGSYPISNGPPSGPPGMQGGTGGIQTGPPAPGYRGPSPPNSQSAPFRPPSSQQQPPAMPPGSQSQVPPSSNQLSNQMGAMNLGPGSQVPGSMGKPNTSNLPTSGYNNTQMGPPAGFPPQGPPGLQGQASRPGFPQRMPGPPQMGGAPMSQAGGPPPMGGAPMSQAGGPPPMGIAPMSQAGGPPPMGGAPMSQAGGPPQMGGAPMSHAGGPPPMGPPPMPGAAKAQSTSNSMAGPPPSMTGPPSGPMGYQQGPPGPGMHPAGSMAGPMPGAPPPVPGGMPPPPSPGGGFQGSQPQGYPGMPSTGPAMSAPTQPQQPRRLDPDQMPSPIQVIEDDRLNRSGQFVTGQRGSVPPLVTTKFTVEDRGNSNPRMIRSSMYNIPCTSDMMKQSHLPFVMGITPFARMEENEAPLPVVDLGSVGPVRCNRCKAYMNPYMQFVDGGRRFQCCFCSCNTDVPPEYFAHLDHTGKRVDCFDRPELCLGSYEFVATTDYCKNNKLPDPPAYIFMIDVSYNSVKSGLLNLLCRHLKEDILVNLPKESGMAESEIRVGFVTYAKELQFYNVKGNLAQPQMLVVSDVQDVFVPLLDGFLVKLSESEAVIDSLLQQIPLTFAESRETEIVLGPVIEAGLDALKAADTTGKLIIFHTSLPIAEAPGKLKNRDDRKLLGTDKEKTILAPQNNYYTKLGQSCVSAGCGVDLFLFPNSYIDIASIAEVPRLTGGNIFKYSYFQADLDGQRLIEDLKSNIMRPIAFDCIMRVRTSTGIRPVDFLGNFYMSNTTDVELANMDCDKTVTVEIKHDDKLSESDGAVVQAAILYTSITGQRRLRIINMALNCCTQMADLFRNCELDTLVNYMAKVAIRESLNSNPKTVRENMMNRCAQILGCYRKNCASPSSAGQLILPECMKLLPLYTNCIIKNHVLQGASEVSTDDRSYLIHTVNAMSVKDSHVFFYPRLMPLQDLPATNEDPDLPLAIRCSYERLKDNGVYLIENGLAMFMWIGLNVPTEWVGGLFGVQSAAQIDIDQTRLQELDTPRSRQVRAIVKKIREERLRHLKLVIVRQRDKLEPVFQQHLVEDRSAGGGASYVDFLCHIHKEIRTLLS